MRQPEITDTTRGIAALRRIQALSPASRTTPSSLKHRVSRYAEVCGTLSRFLRLAPLIQSTEPVACARASISAHMADMHQSPRAHRAHLVTRASGLLVWTALLTGACAPAAPIAEDPTVFGGQGAALTTPKQIPLSAAPAEPDNDPCTAGAPPADHALLDDFEDGDNKVFKAFHREGWLYVATDDSPGQVFPPKGDMRPERLPDASVPDQQFALHGTASGFNAWGVTWGTTLRWVGEGSKCPLNVENFAGIRFRARGKGSLFVRFGTWDTVPPEFEGKCKNRCWDAHSKRVYFTDEWQQQVVLWSQLQQAGWGTEARFDTKHVLNLNFAAEAKDQPVDFWIDDLEFITAEQVANPHIHPTHDTTAPVTPDQTPGAH